MSSLGTSGMLIVGVDCATRANKTGMVRASWDGETLNLEDAIIGSAHNDPAEVVSSWVSSASNVLLALDAPLGWPQPLAHALANHRAGQVLKGKPEELFSRASDRWVKKKLQKQPLEVGANLIARTAYSALRLVEDVRQRTGLEIPLAWDRTFDGVSAIEVYPGSDADRSRNLEGDSELQRPHVQISARRPRETWRQPARPRCGVVRDSRCRFLGWTSRAANGYRSCPAGGMDLGTSWRKLRRLRLWNAGSLQQEPTWSKSTVSPSVG